MSLPTRILSQTPEPEESAARLITFTRHGFPEMAASIGGEIRRHGRAYSFKILRALTNPIVLYYQAIECLPPGPECFEPGSAEYFTHALVGAILRGDEAARDEQMHVFWGSCESETERAIAFLAGCASQCMNLLAQIQQFDAAISAL